MKCSGFPVQWGVKRFGNVLRAALVDRKLRAHERWSRSRLLEHQMERFRAVVAYAREHSPFYRELYEDIPLSGEFSPTDLPPVDKPTLMRNFDDAVTDPRLRLDELHEHLSHLEGDACFAGEYRVFGTSGSTGLRGVFVANRQEWAVVMASSLRCQRYLGMTLRLDRRLRIATIGADNAMHVSTRIPLSGNVGLFRILQLEATQPLPELMAALQEFQPDFLAPYASVGSLLASEQLAGRLHIYPSHVATHSEALTSEMARRMEQAWGHRPFNYYGLTELPNLGTDCGHHRGIHIAEDLCILEPVDLDYDPVPPGEPAAKYLLTNLYNYSQPLIRYEVSDMITLSQDLCPCGRPFAMIQDIGGRREEVMAMPGIHGGVVEVPPLALALGIEAVPGLVEHVLHFDGVTLEVEAIPAAGASRSKIESALHRSIGKELEKLGVIAPPVKVTFLAEVPRQPMGKKRRLRMNRGLSA